MSNHLGYSQFIIPNPCHFPKYSDDPKIKAQGIFQKWDPIAKRLVDIILPCPIPPPPIPPHILSNGSITVISNTYLNVLFTLTNPPGIVTLGLTDNASYNYTNTFSQYTTGGTKNENVTVPTLASLTTYYYTISTTNSSLTGTIQYIPPPILSNGSITVISNTYLNVLFTLTNPPGIVTLGLTDNASYNYTNTFSQYTTGGTKNENVTVPTLASLTTYYYTISTTNSSLTGTIQYIPPPILSNGSITVISNTYLNVLFTLTNPPGIVTLGLTDNASYNYTNTFSQYTTGGTKNENVTVPTLASLTTYYYTISTTNSSLTGTITPTMTYPPNTDNTSSNYWEKDVGANPQISLTDPGYDIIIIGGQSNGVGMDTVGMDTVGQAGIYALATNNINVSIATDPLPQDNQIFAGSPFNGNTWASQGKGFGLPLAKKYVNSGFLKQGRRVLLVQTSLASIGFSTNSWGLAINDWDSISQDQGGKAYLNYLVRVKAAVNQTFSGSSANKNRIVAICWQHGETDAMNNITTLQYKTYLTNFMNNWTSSLLSYMTKTVQFSNADASNVLSNMTLLVGGMTPAAIAGLIGPTMVQANNIMNAQRDVAGVKYTGNAVYNGPSAYVTSQGIGLDELTVSTDPAVGAIHFDHNACDVLATSYADRWFRRLGAMPLPNLRSAFSTYNTKWSDITPTNNTLTLIAQPGGVGSTVRSNSRSNKIVTNFTRDNNALDGTIPYITISNGLPSGDITLSIWVNWTRFSNFNVFPVVFGGSNGGKGGISNNLAVILWSYDASGIYTTQATVTKSGPISPAVSVVSSAQQPYSTWTHNAMTYNNSTGLLTYYINGVSNGSKSVGAGLNTGISGPHMYIGSYQDGVSYFTGYVDDARIYNSCLTSDQVSILYKYTV